MGNNELAARNRQLLELHRAGRADHETRQPPESAACHWMLA
jgi:hypothetical protein